VNYWDTSAIVSLLVRESNTAQRESQLRKINGMVTWWGTRIECVSALHRRERENALSPQALQAALRRLEALDRQWVVVTPSQLIQLRAERLLRLHPLRAADALQLAAALLACQEEPQGWTFHTADSRLGNAAKVEGFVVL
jgi:predicted nucleic acid-binding protein